jgi:hypothetical protein
LAAGGVPRSGDCRGHGDVVQQRQRPAGQAAVGAREPPQRKAARSQRVVGEVQGEQKA